MYLSYLYCNSYMLIRIFITDVVLVGRGGDVISNYTFSAGGTLLIIYLYMNNSIFPLYILIYLIYYSISCRIGDGTMKIESCELYVITITCLNFKVYIF